LLVPPFGNISRRRQALSSFLLRIVNDWNLKQEISDVETARIAYKKRQVSSGKGTKPDYKRLHTPLIFLGEYLPQNFYFPIFLYFLIVRNGAIHNGLLIK